MQKQMKHVEVSTEDSMVYLRQEGENLEQDLIQLAPEQVETLIDWLLEAVREIAAARGNK